MPSHLIDCIKYQEINAPVSAGTNDTDSDIIDTQDADGVLFIVPVTDCLNTGVLTLTMEHSATNSAGAMVATTATTAVTSAADDDLNDKAVILDVQRPVNRYVRLNFVSTVANIATGTVSAIQYKLRDEPATQGADVAGSAKFVNPASA